MICSVTFARYAALCVPRYTSYPPAPHFSPELRAREYRSWLRCISKRNAKLITQTPRPLRYRSKAGAECLVRKMTDKAALRMSPGARFAHTSTGCGNATPARLLNEGHVMVVGGGSVRITA